mgnify:CR=1 FL=1
MAILYTNTSSGYLRKQKKKKVSANQMAQYEKDLREHNKHLRQLQMHGHQMSIEDYILYRKGQYKTKTKKEFKEYKPQPVFTRETPDYPSVSNTLVSGGTIDHKARQERIEVSKQYAVVPAYNKGPYMVVGKEDLKTAGRKV